MHNDRRGTNRYDRMASRTKGFTVIFVSYSWATSSVLNMLPDICRPSRIYAIANCPRSQTWPKTIPPLYIRWMRNMGLRLKGRSLEGEVKSFDKSVPQKSSFLFSPLLSRYSNGIKLNVYSLESESNPIQKVRFVGFDCIQDDSSRWYILVCIRIIRVDGNNQICYRYFLSNEEY